MDLFFQIIDNPKVGPKVKTKFLFQTCVEIEEGGCTLGDSSKTTPEPLETTTVTTPAPLCPPHVFGNVPHPEICQSFYMCAAGQAILLTCNEGREFDPVVGVSDAIFTLTF